MNVESKSSHQSLTLETLSSHTSEASVPLTSKALMIRGDNLEIPSTDPTPTSCAKVKGLLGAGTLKDRTSSLLLQSPGTPWEQAWPPLPVTVAPSRETALVFPYLYKITQISGSQTLRSCF